MRVADGKLGGEEARKDVMKEERPDLTPREDQCFGRAERKGNGCVCNRKVEIGLCVFGGVSQPNVSRRQGPQKRGVEVGLQEVTEVNAGPDVWECHWSGCLITVT